MIQLSTLPLPGTLVGVRAVGSPLGTVSDFALALADLARPPLAAVAPPGVPAAAMIAGIERQMPAADGKDLPVPVGVDGIEMPALTALPQVATPPAPREAEVELAAEPAPPIAVAAAATVINFMEQRVAGRKAVVPPPGAMDPATGDPAPATARAPLPIAAGHVSARETGPDAVAASARTRDALPPSIESSVAIAVASETATPDVAAPGDRPVEAKDNVEADAAPATPVPQAVAPSIPPVVTADPAPVATHGGSARAPRPATSAVSTVAPAAPSSIERQAQAGDAAAPTSAASPARAAATTKTASVAGTATSAANTRAPLSAGPERAVPAASPAAAPDRRGAAPAAAGTSTATPAVGVPAMASGAAATVGPVGGTPISVVPSRASKQHAASPLEPTAPPIVASAPMGRQPETPVSLASSLAEPAPDVTPGAAARIVAALRPAAAVAVSTPVPTAVAQAAPAQVVPVMPNAAASPSAPAGAVAAAVPVRPEASPRDATPLPFAAPAAAPADRSRTAAVASAPVIVTVAALPAPPPPQPQPQPAARAFAAAMFAARAPVEAARDETADDGPPALVPGVVPAAQHVPAIAVAPPAQGQGPALDLSRGDWMASMIDRIESLRDEGGAVRETRMKLAPDALGSVEVSVRRDESGAMQVRIAADTPQARAILAEAAPKLAEMAEARGVKLGGSSVDAGVGSGAGSADQQRRDAPATPAATRPRPVSAAAAETITDTDSRIA